MTSIPTEKELRKWERDCRQLQAKARSWGVNPIRDNVMGRTMAKLRKRMTVRAEK